MRISNLSFSPISKINYNRQSESLNRCSNLSQLQQDTVSFCGLKTKWGINRLGVDLNNLNNDDAIKVFNYLGMEAEENAEGKLVLSHYKMPGKKQNVHMNKFGINEEELLKNVAEIKGDADFMCCKAKRINNLKKVGGDVYIWGRINWLEEMSNLTHVGGTILTDYRGINSLKDLSSLEYVGKSACLIKAKVKDLSKLKFVGEDLTLSNTSVKDLSSLEEVGRDASFSDLCNVDLSKLRKVGRHLWGLNTYNLNLSGIQHIYGGIDFSFSNKINLSNLETVTGVCDLNYAINANLSKLKTIGGTTILHRAERVDLSSLEIIGGNIDCCRSVDVDISKLQNVAGDIDFRYVTNLRVSDDIWEQRKPESAFYDPKVRYADEPCDTNLG